MPNQLPFGWGQGIPQQSAADYNAANPNTDPNTNNGGPLTDRSQSYVELAKTYTKMQGSDIGGDVNPSDDLAERDPIYKYLTDNGWLRWGEGAGGQGPVLG